MLFYSFILRKSRSIKFIYFGSPWIRHPDSSTVRVTYSYSSETDPLFDMIPRGESGPQRGSFHVFSFPVLREIPSFNPQVFHHTNTHIQVFYLEVVYYESRKRELKIRLMNEGRCDERLLLISRFIA